MTFLLFLALVGLAIASDPYGEKKQTYSVSTSYSYRGRFEGKCSNDGIYYKDERSFVMCSNGNAYQQPCAPGSRNGAYASYAQGKSYGFTDFCGVNLVDFGYAARGYSNVYDDKNQGYGYKKTEYRTYDNGHRDGYGDSDNNYGHQDNNYRYYDNSYVYRDNGYGKRDNGYRYGGNSYGNPDNSYGYKRTEYRSYDNGHRDGYDDRFNGFGYQENSYGHRKNGYGYRDNSYGYRENSYGPRDSGYNRHEVRHQSYSLSNNKY